MVRESAHLAHPGPGACIRVEFARRRGLVQTFVVQLELWDGEHWRAAVRFDTSHGRAHKDTLNRAGELIAKEWIPVEWTYNDALTYAINDIRARWQEYQQQFWER